MTCTFEVGDIVKVINKNKLYPSYRAFYGKCCPNRALFNYGDLGPNNGDYLEVVAVKRHSVRYNSMVAVVTNGKQDFVIDTQGLFLSYRDQPKPHAPTNHTQLKKLTNAGEF